MSDFNDEKLWNLLSDIGKRLSNIEDKMDNIIRMEEKVKNHEDTLKRFGAKIDQHTDKIATLENHKAYTDGYNKVSARQWAYMASGVITIISGIVVYFVTK